MSVGSLGSVDCVSPKSPRSQDGSPTASAQPAGGGGGDSIFGTAYQVQSWCLSSLSSRMERQAVELGHPSACCALPELHMRSIMCNEDVSNICHFATLPSSAGASGGGTAGCAR
jgi:hypothetical protein